MALKTEKIVFAVIYLIFPSMSLFLIQVMQKYHRGKPLGQQSLHGKVTEEIFLGSLKISVISKQFRNVVFELISGSNNLPRNVAFMFHTLDFLTLSHLYMALLVLLSVKYISIYHGHLLANVDESKLVPQLKWSLYILPCIQMFVEFNYLTRIDDIAKFQSLVLGN